MILGLLITKGAQKGRYLYISELEPFSIGRDENSDFQIKNVHVSTNHCFFFRHKETLKVRDYSTNGTRINGHLLEKETAVLKFADIIRVGDTTFQVINLDPTEVDSDFFDYQSTLAELRENQLVEDSDFLAIIGPYFGIEIIGEGSFASVYKAIYPEKEKLVAIKLFKNVEELESDFEDRLQREVEILRNLNHDSVIRLYDSGVCELKKKSHHYLVLEYFPGINLDHHVATYGAMHWTKVIKILTQVLPGLAYMHSEGVLHRDLKPQNIMYNDIKEVTKIIDLGLGKSLTKEGESDFNTPHYFGMGSPNFAPIEQWNSLKAVDHRADIYSLGATAYFMLTGILPYGNHDNNYHLVYERFINQELDPLEKLCTSDTPKQLIAIISKMMAFDLEDRYNSVKDILVEIQKLLSCASQSI